MQESKPLKPTAAKQAGRLKLDDELIGTAAELEMGVQKRWIISVDTSPTNAPRWEIQKYLKSVHDRLAKILPEDSFVVHATNGNIGRIEILELEMGESQVIEQEIARLKTQQK